MSRQVASHSICTWSTQVICNIVLQFVPGYCEIPTDLTDGARKTWDLAAELYGCPVRPVRVRYVSINHDGHGGLRTAGKQEKRKVLEKYLQQLFSTIVKILVQNG